LTHEPVRGVRLATKFDLSMYAIESPDGLRVSFEYATDLFDESTLTRMLDQFACLLAAAVADPDRRVGELELVTPEERAGLVRWFCAGVGGVCGWVFA